MVKSDISEIRKRFKKDSGNITRISGCYVKNDGTIISTFAESPVEMTEEEMDRYLDIARKSLSGKEGNNLLCLPFQSDTDDIRASFETVRKSGLKDQNVMMSFYQNIIDNYDTTDNYLIVVITDTYDVMSKSKDNALLDESEETFDYFIAAICPVKLTKPALGFIDNEQNIGLLPQTWTVQSVDTAFMYPAFSDRSVDTDHILTYSKNTKEPKKALFENGFGLKMHMSSDIKQDIFLTSAMDAVSDKDDTDEQMFNIADGLSDYIEKQKVMYGEKASTEISAEDIEEIAKNSGIDENGVEKIKKSFEDFDDIDRPSAEGLLDKKLLKNQKLYHEKHALQQEVIRLNKSTDKGKAEGISISIPEDRRGEIQIIDTDSGRKITVPFDDTVTVKGIDADDIKNPQEG